MTEAKNNYKRLTARECAEALLSVKSPVVMIHVRPDGDAVGSGAALCEIFRQLGESASLLAPEKIPARLKFITDECCTELTESRDGRAAVSIDTASPTQLGSLYDENDKPMLMIDHHAVGEMYADGYIAPEASSAAEALFDIADELISLGKIKMNKTLAYALYTAISSDTGRFCYSNTAPKTHIRAAELLTVGIDAADINHRLFFSKDIRQITAEGFIGANIKTASGGKIAYSAITIEDMKRLSLESGDFETAIDIVRSLSGCEVAIVARELENSVYKLSLRSTGANVAEIARQLGGGGHIRAAGCTVTAASADEALKTVLTKIIL